MRATPPPVALPVAAAAIPLAAAALVPLAAPSTALAERWLRPVTGEVARTFDYTRASPFTRGAHRGVNLAATPGTPVRAACGGVVMHAGPVAGRAGVVSVRCGGRRVSYLPLDAIAVRRGGRVTPGTRLGAVAPGHGGLHLGVRRETDAFAYEDPLALLGGFEPPGAPLASPRPAARRLPAPRTERPRQAPRRAPRVAGPRRLPRLAPRALPRVAGPPPVARVAAPRPASRGVAPWPVWLGLTLLLSGAAASGHVVRQRRRRRAPLHGLRTTAQSAQ